MVAQNGHLAIGPVVVCNLFVDAGSRVQFGLGRRLIQPVAREGKGRGHGPSIVEFDHQHSTHQ
jgi:hypothetical protein